MIALREGDTDRAREVLAQATGASPEFAPAWSLAGDIERGLGNLDAAEAAYGRAIDLRFKNSHDLFGRALTRIARGDHPGAREDAGRLARIPPVSPGAASSSACWPTRTATSVPPRSISVPRWGRTTAICPRSCMQG